MTDPERTEAYLRLILDRVDGWLRFAEVKNAGLIALSGTVTTALVAALRDLGGLSVQGRPLLVLAMVLFLAAMAIGIYSYLPRLRPALLGTGHPPSTGEADNLFYYGDVAKYGPESLVQAVAERYVSSAPPHQDVAVEVKSASHDRPKTARPAPDLPTGRAGFHLAAQATVNAQITLRKMRLFERGAALVLAGSVAYAAAVALPR